MMFAMGLRSAYRHRRGRTPVITVCCTRFFTQVLAYHGPFILGTIERSSGEEKHHWWFPEDGRNNVLAVDKCSEPDFDKCVDSLMDWHRVLALRPGMAITVKV